MAFAVFAVTACMPGGDMRQRRGAQARAAETAAMADDASRGRRPEVRRLRSGRRGETAFRELIRSDGPERPHIHETSGEGCGGGHDRRH